MPTTSVETRHRYDRTLRVVMWSDAFLSVAFVLLCIVAVPVVAALGLPHRALETVGLTAVICGVLLAAFGAVTAVTLMLRMRSGLFQLPARLWLPLPPGMRPTEYRPRRSRRVVRSRHPSWGPESWRSPDLNRAGAARVSSGGVGKTST